MCLESTDCTVADVFLAKVYFPAEDLSVVQSFFSLCLGFLLLGECPWIAELWGGLR